MSAQAEIKIYTTPWCPYCIRAKHLLKKKNVNFEEIDVAGNRQLRSQIALETGKTSFPQIFIDGENIGGCDELYALDAQKKLDGLLGLA